MRAQRWKSILVRSLPVLVAPMLTGATGLSTDFNNRLLHAHNVVREQVGLEPMRWDPKLAASAQQWADRLAATGRLEHAPQGRGNPQGENLWAGTSDYFSPEAMVGAWADEKRYFKVGAFPNNSTTGDISDVGHYTQIVWRQTGHVGCARASNEGKEFLVCRYARAGNWIGERPF